MTETASRQPGAAHNIRAIAETSETAQFGEQSHGEGAASLVAALDAEIETIAVMSGLVASVLNRALARHSINGVEQMLAQMPNQPLLLTMSARMDHAEDIADVTAQAGELAGALANAKRGLRSFVDARGAGRSVGELVFVAELWRTVCRCARLARQTIGACPHRALACASHIDTARVRDMLINCEAGGWRSIGPDDVEMPEWAQRRRHRRVMLNMRALASYGYTTRDVLLRDASPGGFGIDFADNLGVGERIDLTLSDGRTLPGRVVWSRGQRAGIELFEALAHDDVLFAWDW